MVCVSCGHCCRVMSPINHGYCPLLREAESNTGKIYYCSDYENRPKECQDHSYPAKVCPIGISTLKLISNSLVQERVNEVQQVLNIKTYDKPKIFKEMEASK